MCDPITATVVATTVATGAYTAYNQYSAGRAEQNYNNAQAFQQDQQGKMALQQGERQSTAIQDTAKIQGKQFKTEAAQYNASQRAALAANGLQGVTAEDIQSDTINKQKLDEAAIRYNADVKSWESNENAKNENYAYQEQAKGYRNAGRNARAAGKREAFTTLLGTASSVASSAGGAFAKKAPAGTMTKSGPISYYPRR